MLRYIEKIIEQGLKIQVTCTRFNRTLLREIPFIRLWQTSTFMLLLGSYVLDNIVRTQYISIIFSTFITRSSLSLMGSKKLYLNCIFSQKQPITASLRLKIFICIKNKLINKRLYYLDNLYTTRLYICITLHIHIKPLQKYVLGSIASPF